MFCLFLTILASTYPKSKVTAQATKTVECGTVLEAELTANSPQKHDTYTVEVSAGDTISIRIDPIGQDLTPQIILYGPSNKQVTYAVTSNSGRPIAISDYVLGSTGRYSIVLNDVFGG